jgi:hypothetical protein
MKRVCLIVVSNVILISVLLGLIIISCGERAATVTTIFTVSEYTTQYLPTTTENSFSIAALGSGEKISFTPTSIKVKIDDLRLNTSSDWCSGRGEESPYIMVTSHPYIEQDLGGFELIGKSAFESLASFSVTVNEMQFDEYQYPSLNAHTIISGVVNESGTQYTLYDVYGEGIQECNVMPQPIIVEEEYTPTLLIIFDVENCATLKNGDLQPYGGPVPGYDNIWVNVENLIYALYVGEGEPIVDKYEVVLDSDVFGDHTAWYLKVLTVVDPDGNLTDVKWHTVYRVGFSGDTWDPDHLVYPLITAVDENTYSIKSNPDWYEEIPLEFPAFKLEDHAGTLIYDGDNYTYTATKR